MAKRKRAKRKRASPIELEKRVHRSEIRSVFKNLGFKKVSGISDKLIEFEERKGDFDDIFVCDNLIVLTEYTVSQAEGIGKHLLTKKILFDHVTKHKSKFLTYLEDKFPTFKSTRDDFYDHDQCRLIILYCSKSSVSAEHKAQVKDVVYFEYPIVRYFKSITTSIKLSARFEFFNFLGLNHDEVGRKSVKGVKKLVVWPGTVLPETYSKFARGYKVVSFYADPETLLEKAFVLRKHGWKDEAGLYQRMIVPSKIKAIRNYLVREGRVFINNIIVTLPAETVLLNEREQPLQPSEIIRTESVKIQIPDGGNIIGLIDGQHRVYAYHEGGKNDDQVKHLREKQNLLVTGIIYPKGIKEEERIKFEARLFLEINSNQANAKSDLKQAINVILKPYSSESIARAIINKLNRQGPLENIFEEHFYDKGKVKTTSIVSYGLKPLVKLSGKDSFFSLWNKTGKQELTKEQDHQLLDEYINFCATHLRIYFAAIKNNLEGTNKWTIDNDVNNRALSTTSLNGIIICLRRLIENKKSKRKFEDYKERFKGIESFNFGKYKSSQYGTLADDLYSEFFH